jgi:hypothetical protein
MKRKKNLVIIIVCAAFFFIVILVNMYRGAGLMTRSDRVQVGISHLAVFIETYRDEHGKYPSSLEDLLSGSKPAIIDDINQYQILHDSFKDKYEYQPLTNGFLIVVTAPGSWFVKYDRIEKRYRIGEAFQ